MGNRTVHFWRALTALAVIALFAALFATPAAARSRFSAKARVHVTRTVTTSISTTVAATAAAGTAPNLARVTVRVSATASGEATRGAWATVRRTAKNPAAARKAARRAARALAARRAHARAAAVARSRALANARAAATAKAQTAARTAAQQQVRTLVAQQRPVGCTSLPKAGGGSWTCTFDDEFDGSSLDRSKWVPLTTATTDLGTGGTCFLDSPDNVAVGGGVLTLTVRRLAAPIACRTRTGSFDTSYTGGQIGTPGKFSQAYGRFAVRAKFPAATLAGLQSSLWMWPDTVVPGEHDEIDIAEWYSQYSQLVVPYLHYNTAGTPVKATAPLTATNVVTNTNFAVKDANAFHEYAVEWTPKVMSIFVDGHPVLVDNVSAAGSDPFARPYFLLLSACLGQGTNALTARTPLPAATQIDWVRAWK
jgi:beta-glucanase (GH16 family)